MQRATLTWLRSAAGRGGVRTPRISFHIRRQPVSSTAATFTSPSAGATGAGAGARTARAPRPRRVLRWVVLGGGAVALGFFANGVVMLHKHRYRASTDVDFHELLTTVEQEPEGWFARSSFQFARAVIIGFMSNLVAGYLHFVHNFEFVNPEDLHKYVDNDRGGVPLVTVTNHISVVDDPGLISAMVPFKTRVNPRLMRWSVCTEEICFSSPNLATFFTAGKGIPMQRGGSIHQKGLAILQSKVNNGDWAHIFAEGRIWQDQGIPLRDASGAWCSVSGRCAEPWARLGPFKWGVGKVIANAERTPIVLPIFHLGLNELMPQSRDNQCLSSYPLGHGHRISVQVGKPVPVQDLIDAYHVGARARAQARNVKREQALHAALASTAPALPAASGSAAAGVQPAPASRSGVWAWVSSWWTASPPAPPPSPAATPLDRHLRSAPVGVEPVNTVEEGADHTGASARIATIARPPPADVLAALSAPKHVAISPAAELSREVRSVVTGLEERARDTTERAFEAALDTTTRALETARDIEIRARELVKRLKDLAPGAAKKREEGEADAASAAPTVDVVSRWAASVSVPAPFRRQPPSSASDAAAGASAAGAAAAAGGDASAAPTSAQGASGEQGGAAARTGPYRVPTASEPAIELIPTRTLRTGVVVPQFVDAPLRIVPPDHAVLTPLEAMEEEDIRLQLYADITNRIHDAMIYLEATLLELRSQRVGWQESRPCEGVNHPNGLTHEEEVAERRARLQAVQQRMATWPTTA